LTLICLPHCLTICSLSLASAHHLPVDIHHHYTVADSLMLHLSLGCCLLLQWQYQLMQVGTYCQVSVQSWWHPGLSLDSDCALKAQSFHGLHNLPPLPFDGTHNLDAAALHCLASLNQVQSPKLDRSLFNRLKCCQVQASTRSFLNDNWQVWLFIFGKRVKTYDLKRALCRAHLTELIQSWDEAQVGKKLMCPCFTRFVNPDLTTSTLSYDSQLDIV
jgi:hypothetical protein